MSESKYTEYTYKRAIRFSLRDINKKFKHSDSKEKVDIYNFYYRYYSFLDDLKKFLYKNDQENGDNKKIDGLISVNKSWLKKYFKIDFYHSNKKNKFIIEQLPYVKDKFNEYFREIEKNLDEIQKRKDSHELPKNPTDADINYLKERNTRKSEIAFRLIQINKEINLFGDFLKLANHKNNSDTINCLLNEFNELEEIFIDAQKEYLPSQGAGLCIAQGSFNYYTVNKKPKEYYSKKEDEVIAEQKNKITVYSPQEHCLQIKFKDEMQYSEHQCDFKNYEKNWIDKELNGKTELNLKETYDLLKKFKAAMKSQFLEDCKKFNAEKLKDKYWFFEEQSFVEKTIQLTKEIEKLNGRKDKRAISNEKKKRGDFFIKKGKDDSSHFKNWVDLVNIYKEIAKKNGRLKAQLKGLEKEKIEAEQNQYWSLILQENNNKYLFLVPREKMGAFKEKLQEIKKQDVAGNIILHTFKSLTKRALHKLCFAEESTFAKEMEKEDEALYFQLQDAKKATNNQDTLRKNRSQKPKNELELHFFKALLGSEYICKRLDLKDFDLSKIKNVQNLNEFELELENACYKKIAITITGKNKQELIDEYDIKVCKITSYDIKERNKNEFQTPKSEYRRHTREIWNKFWEGDDSLRLNPQIKIHFKEKIADKESNEFKKYLLKKSGEIEKLDYRKLYDQYTLTLSFELNAGKKHTDLAFAKTEDIIRKIDDFNDKFNQQNWDNFYKYGIDRGNIELATLCISKFNKNETYKVNEKILLKPSFPEGEEDIKCYKLKEEWYIKTAKPSSERVNYSDIKERRPVANLSYFIDKIEDKKWFEKHTCTCIDLTTAKIIKDKIILNGDILTFLKLKKEAAKKIIFENHDEISTLEWGEKIGESIPLQYSERDEEGNPKKTKKGEIDYRQVYFFDEKFKDLILNDDETYTQESIKNRFDKYLKELKENGHSSHTPTVPKINHLRDAVIANMVGVITFLQKKYPGFIILEDLDKETIEKHFQDLYINIGRKLEFALFSKFQSFGWIPPHIKNIVQLREDYRKRQYKPFREEFEKAAEKIYEDNKNKKDYKDLSKEKGIELAKTKNRTNKIIDFRKNNNLNHQIGAIIFVDEINTSKNCPNCEKAWSWLKKDDGKYNNKEELDKEDLKFNQRRYKCGPKERCDFDTKYLSDQSDFQFLKEINDPDKVAAYNVAKKIKNKENITKMSSYFKNTQK